MKLLHGSGANLPSIVNSLLFKLWLFVEWLIFVVIDVGPVDITGCAVVVVVVVV